MGYNDAHPSTLHADAHIERAAIIRLVKAHAADCERRGTRMMRDFALALVSEIEDAMQHDRAHVEALENRAAAPVWASLLTTEEIADIKVAHTEGSKIDVIRIVRWCKVGDSLSNDLRATRDWVYENWTALGTL